MSDHDAQQMVCPLWGVAGQVRNAHVLRMDGVGPPFRGEQTINALKQMLAPASYDA